MRKSLQICLFLFGLAAATPASAGLITNGGFELGSCGGGNSLGAHGCNTASMPGWTLDGDVNWYQSGFDLAPGRPLSPRSGSSAINVAFGDGSVRFIRQTLPTSPGQRYNVSFWIGTDSFNGGDGAVLAQITDGTSNTITFSEIVARPTQGSRWERVGFSFIADGTSNTITLGEQPGLPYQLSYLGIDDVGVSAVPEASTWVMMLLGFASLAFAGSRVNFSPSPATLPRSAASARR